MTLGCLRKRSLDSFNLRFLAFGVNPAQKFLQQRSALGLATADSDFGIQRQLSIQDLQEELRLFRLQHIFWQSFRTDPTPFSKSSSSETEPSSTATSKSWWPESLLQLQSFLRAFSSLPGSFLEKAGSSRPIPYLEALGFSPHHFGGAPLAWIGSPYHTTASSDPSPEKSKISVTERLEKRWQRKLFNPEFRRQQAAETRAARTRQVRVLGGTSEAAIYRCQHIEELDVEAYWQQLDDETASRINSADSEADSLSQAQQANSPTAESSDPSAGLGGEARDSTVDSISQSGSALSEERIGVGDSGAPDDRPTANQRALQPSKRSPSLARNVNHAKDVDELIEIVDERQNISLPFAYTTLYQCALHVGVKRSDKENLRWDKKPDRPAKFYQRQKLKRSLAFRRILECIVEHREKATMSVLIQTMWALSSLRLTGTSPVTPQSTQILAEEILRRGEDGSFESVPPHQLCKLAFGLAQNMRSDCPWDELLQLLADGLMHNRDEVFAGPGSAMLKCIATYKVVYDDQPVPESTLDFLAESLKYPDPFSPGPQAISQGLYSLAKLGYRGDLPNLTELAKEVLSQIDRSDPLHRQSIANTFWALAELDVPMDARFYKQIMQTVLAHAYHFLSVHFGQVFKAIEKYGVPLTRKQAETFGQCILVCLPSYPEKSQIPGWQCLIPHLQAFAYELQAADGKPMPKSMKEAIHALHHLYEEPKLRIRKRRNVINAVMYDHGKPQLLQLLKSREERPAR